MKDIVSIRCEYENCEGRAEFSGEDGKLRLCINHATDDHHYAHYGKCKRCPFRFAVRRLNGECRKCFEVNHPDDKRVCLLRAKERFFLNAIACEVKLHGENHRVRGGTSNRRPDAYIRVGDSHAIVIEIDEHDHVGYSQHDEALRNQQLRNDFNTPVVFIRINPDPNNDIFSQMGNAIVVANNEKFEMFSRGIIQTIKAYMNAEITDSITVKLYFDQ